MKSSESSMSVAIPKHECEGLSGISTNPRRTGSSTSRADVHDELSRGRVHVDEVALVHVLADCVQSQAVEGVPNSRRRRERVGEAPETP